MRFLKYLTLIAVVVMGVSSCEEDKFTTNETDTARGTVLYASTGQSSLSKLTFSDNTSSIDLQWELEDAFTIYDSAGDKLGTFKCTDIESGKFESEDLIEELSIGSTYTAKYNELEDADAIYSQNGDDINNLKNACQMEAKFVYGVDDTITFEHTMAVMTFTFESDDLPACLIFKNGVENEIYTVTYSTITADETSGLYTSHIMINPCEVLPRILTFSLYDSEGTAYDIRTVGTSKAYEAGKRYVSPVSTLANSVPSGSGTEFEPYIIENAAQLRALSDSVNAGNSYSGDYFILINDIDLGGVVTTETASLSKSGDSENTVFVPENEFTPIGNSSKCYFGGTFDGKGFKVTGLYINQPEPLDKGQGLFGNISGATIKNLGVSGSVTGETCVGGIVGYASSDASGSVRSYIISCYNAADVSVNPENISSNYLGGIVGEAHFTDIVSCYNTGKITGAGSYIGGLVGRILNCQLASCYNVGTVSSSTSTSYIGSIVGYAGINRCSALYYLKDSYSVGFGDGVYQSIEMTSSEMQEESFVISLNIAAYEYNVDVNTPSEIESSGWKAVAGAYPILDYGSVPTDTEDDMVYNEDTDTYEIYTATGLTSFASLVNDYGETTINGQLMSDIDLASATWTPIGSSNCSFEGTFDGNGKKVTGLYIYSSSSSLTYQGLFGYIYCATIKNLGVSGSITGGNSSQYVGGIVGYAGESYIISCYNTVEISTGNGSKYVGGVVGYAQMSYSIISCYNTATVSVGGGSQYVGGVVGYMIGSTSLVRACYNVGTVTSATATYTGSLIGQVYSGSVSSCYYLTGSYSKGIGSGSGSTTAMSSSAMQEEDFVTDLNKAAADYNANYPEYNDAYDPELNGDYPRACAWILQTDDYPTFDYDAVPL